MAKNKKYLGMTGNGKHLSEIELTEEELKEMNKPIPSDWVLVIDDCPADTPITPEMREACRRRLREREMDKKSTHT